MSAKVSVCVALAMVSVGSGRRVGSSHETVGFKTKQTAAKGPCPDYFGDMGGIVTVADPDVGHTGASAPYCTGNGMSTPCIYMHFAGPANECQSPAPPDGCHRYHTVRYSECDELQNFNFDARIDTTGAFNTDGVFIACANRVISNEIACYGPPAGEPEACECPEREPEEKYPCENYFGDLEGPPGTHVTVVDPDVGLTSASQPYCDSNRVESPCIYMHKAGHWRLDNECQSPAPPDGCHRYHTVKYSECDELNHFNFDTRIDTTGAFNTDGVFIACADRVISHEINCYGPPHDMPEACECPEREPEVKYPCENYFGDLEGIVTVADPDVGHTSASAPYCDTNRVSTPCIYMHKAGPWRLDNECQSPAPPDGCHRYHTVKYSECDELENFNFDARIDTTNAFNTDGVFIACADRVISNEVNCYGPPHDQPEACDCSGSQAYWSVEQRPVNFNCCKEVSIDQEASAAAAAVPDLAETAYEWCNPNRVPEHKRIPEFLQGLFWLKDYGDFSAIAFCTSLAEWDNETHTALLSPWMTWVEQRLWDDGLPPQELYKTAGSFGPEKPEGEWRHADYDGHQEFPSPLLYELAFEMPDDPDEHHRADVGFTHSSRRIINWLARLPLNEIHQTPDGTVTREQPGDIWERPSLLFGVINVHHYYPVRIMDGRGNIHRERYELMKNSYAQRNATFSYCEWNC